MIVWENGSSGSHPEPSGPIRRHSINTTVKINAGLSEGDELRRLLEIVSKQGLRALTVPELDTLRTLLAAKNYGDDKKAEKSRKKLMRQINVEFYNKHSPRRWF